MRTYKCQPYILMVKLKDHDFGFDGPIQNKRNIQDIQPFISDKFL